MSLFIDRCTGYDGNGSQIDYYVISTKKVAREFDHKEDVINYVKNYLDCNWKECEKLGKLKSILSEND